MTALPIMAYIGNKGERQGIEALFNLYKKQMFVLAVSILKNESDAEDAVQNAFIRIIGSNSKTILNIENDTDVRNYMLKSAKNASIDILRKRNRQITASDFIGGGLQASTALDDTDFIKTICDRLDYEQLVSMMQRLAPKYKDVLYYHFVLELSIEETAKILNQKRSTTKMQLVRGKRQLIDLMNAKGGAIYGDE